MVREWAGIMNTAYAEPRMAEIKANLRRNLLRVERADHERQRRVFPRPGTDTGHRVRAAGRAWITSTRFIAIPRTTTGRDMSRGDRINSQRPAPRSQGVVTLALCASVLIAMTAYAHRLDEYLQAVRVDLDLTRVEVRLALTPGVDVSDTIVREIDADHDGRLAQGEQAAYVSRGTRCRARRRGRHRCRIAPDVVDLSRHVGSARGRGNDFDPSGRRDPAAASRAAPSACGEPVSRRHRRVSRQCARTADPTDRDQRPAAKRRSERSDDRLRRPHFP